MYVISVASSALRSTRQTDKPSALLDENLERGARRRSETERLQRIAAELKNQYAVAYSRPPTGKSGTSGKSTERLNVSLERRGVMLRAPSKVPGR